MAERVVIKERVEVDPDQPLPDFDLPQAKAYRATARREEHGDLVAYVCDARVPYRHEDIEPVRGLTSSAMMRFVEWGVAAWAPARRRLPVLVYERPPGGRVAHAIADVIEPMSDERIVRGFVTPAIGILRDLSTRGIPHRAIRPDNLYFADTGKKQVMLGDCLTSPPGLNNPAFCETLEQAMAEPSARGRGGIADDLYSLGVCIVFLLLGRNPVHELGSTEIIERKIAQGSYATLTAGARIQMNMMELLRGLLSDDARERWSVREVELWIGGRRLTPKQAKLPAKAARPILIGGRDHENVRSVAEALGRNWLVAGEVVRGQDFDNWLRRSLNDEKVLENVNKVLGNHAAVQNAAEAETPRLITRACMALDPGAPIRHKGFAAHVDGVGAALALDFERDDVRQKVADFINGRFVGLWMSLQARTRSDLNELYALFDKLPLILNQTGPGFGIERVLYQLNDHVHCRSPLIEHLYVTRIEELVPALERVAASKDRSGRPMDRHIAAFAVARSPDVDERFVRPLGGTDNSGTDHVLAALTLLARVQVMTKSGPAPNLAAWFVDLMKSAVNGFHNLKQRKAMEQSISRAADTGLLMELQNIYGDTKASQRDQQGYTRAQQEHQHCGAQIQQLTIELQNRDHMATELGEQVAAVTSGVVGSIGSTAIIIMFML
ncbi:hypothetical protein GCM10017083_31660 [Thalassobaculum fulvum]|uniref:Protein kinase domain-containing protein n=1 Tax=Thalassobaculum fulvum TaxID=1633335 RepID=A0A919CQA4_9PROT|nr:serine/threonine-protein kinase [Thalassobaculum fulvum]GHD54301.1 hypothetical protein GCM10017083_31660 [Thalassobaculum fulvum]